MKRDGFLRRMVRYAGLAAALACGLAFGAGVMPPAGWQRMGPVALLSGTPTPATLSNGAQDLLSAARRLDNALAEHHKDLVHAGVYNPVWQRLISSAQVVARGVDGAPLRDYNEDKLQRYQDELNVQAQVLSRIIERIEGPAPAPVKAEASAANKQAGGTSAGTDGTPQLETAGSASGTTGAGRSSASGDAPSSDASAVPPDVAPESDSAKQAPPKTDFPGPSGDRPRIAVLWYDDTNLPYGLRGQATLTLVNGMETRLTQSGRFEVYERSQLKRVLQEHQISMEGVLDPATAVEDGKLAGVQQVVYGEVQQATCGVTRLAGRHGNDSYSLQAHVVVHHAVADVETARILDSKIETLSGFATTSGYPSDADLEEACLQCLQKSRWTPVASDSRGHVVRIDADSLLIDLGSNTGAGPDIDLQFYRLGEPINVDGHVVNTRDPVTAQWKGQKKAHLCIGRPVQVHTLYSQVEVGYYGDAGFAFGKTRFKRNKACLNAVRVGDLVAIVPRSQ